MAYYNSDDDEEKKLDENGQQIGQQSSVINSEGGPASSPDTSPSQARTNPGNFVGIQQYLDQNKNQSSNLANQIGDYANQKTTAAGSTLQENQNKFNSQVDANTINLDQNLFNEAQTNAENVVKDPSKVQSFQKMRDAQYNGPQSFETTDYFQPTKQAVQGAVNYSKNLATIDGRNQALSDVQNKGRYSKGIQTLDSAILGVNPETQNVFNQSAQKAQDLNTNLGNITAQGNQKAMDAKTATDLTRNTILGSFSGDNSVQNQLQNNLTSKANQISTDGLNQARTATSKLQNGQQLDANEQSLAGLGNNYQNYLGRVSDLQSYGQHGYDDLSQFSSIVDPLQQSKQVNAQNVATNDEYARYAALNDLMGTNSKFLNDPSLAGTYNNDFLNFDNSRAEDELRKSLQNETLNSFANQGGGQYYSELGEKTGQGGRSYDGRDTNSLIKELISSDRGMNEEELQKYFNKYNYPGNGNDVDPVRKNIVNLINSGRQKYRDIN